MVGVSEEFEKVEIEEEEFVEEEFVEEDFDKDEIEEVGSMTNNSKLMIGRMFDKESVEVRGVEISIKKEVGGTNEESFVRGS